MDIKEIMTEITQIMSTYDLSFESALEVSKLEKYEQLLKKLNKLDIDIVNLGNKLDKIIEAISYTSK